MNGEITVYHGSRQIVEFPEIRTARFHKDFYFGFYCTLFYEQAKRWAVRYQQMGMINEYIYTPNDTLKVLKFPEMTEGMEYFSRATIDREVNDEKYIIYFEYSNTNCTKIWRRQGGVVWLRSKKYGKRNKWIP